MTARGLGAPKTMMINRAGYPGTGRAGDKGFTIIELMAVLAIVSILAMIALPVYSDYVLRSKISEGLGFAGAAKTMVTETYYSTNILPTDNNEAGLADPNSFSALEHVDRVEVSSVPVPGAVTITFSIPNLGSDNKLQLLPQVQDSELLWICQPAATDGVPDNALPANCRN
jgi:type IV pilus assembly protein PilA